MFRFLKEISHFSRREKNALIFILTLIFLSFILRLWLANRTVGEIYLSPEQEKEIHAFINSFEFREKKPLKHADENVEKPIVLYFDFDPNTLGMDSLKKLGISDFAASNILRYREAGGVFENPGDLIRIYGFNAEKLDDLYPFIKIRRKGSAKSAEKEMENEERPLGAYTETRLIELNSAKFNDLIEIPGMSPEVASRIIRYRELLGGFHADTQIAEVYGINDSLLDRLSGSVWMDSSLLRKVSLKTGTFTDFLRHPYLSKEDVEEIFSLKDFYMDSFRFEHLKTNRILPESTLIKMKPYLE